MRLGAPALRFDFFVPKYSHCSSSDLRLCILVSCGCSDDADAGAGAGAAFDAAFDADADDGLDEEERPTVVGPPRRLRKLSLSVLAMLPRYYNAR